MKRIKQLLLISILGISLSLGTVGCKKEQWGGDAMTGALMASMVKGLATGNCLISINAAGLWNGTVVQKAIASGASGTTDSANTFDKVDYQNATGKTLTDTEWGLVSYNEKYDAFMNPVDASKFTVETRNKILKYGHGATLAGVYLSGPATVCKADATTAGATLKAAADAVLAKLTDAEKTDLDDFFKTTTTFASTGTAGVGAALSAVVAGACSATLSSLLSGGLTALHINYTQYLSSSAAAVRFSKGSGIAACAQIPKASCSFGGLTTANRLADVKNAIAVTQTLKANKDCPAYNGNLYKGVLSNLIKGLPTDATTENAELAKSGLGLAMNGAGNTGELAGFSKSTDLYSMSGTLQTVTTTTNSVLASSAYPKFGSLVSMGFGSLHPMKEGNTAYNTDSASTSALLATGGSNIAVTSVDSCVALGLSEGPYPNAKQGSRKPLAEPREIAYQFSTNGQASTAYAKIASSSAVFLTTVTTSTAGTDVTSSEVLINGMSVKVNFTTPAADGSMNSKSIVVDGQTAVAGKITLNTSSGEKLTFTVDPITYSTATTSYQVVVRVSADTSTTFLAADGTAFPGKITGGYPMIPSGSDMIACNSSFREKSPVSAALANAQYNGDQKLPVDISSTGADSGKSSLLSLCVYGNDTTANTTLGTVLSTALGGYVSTGTSPDPVQACSELAKAAASSFAEVTK
ncbi:MAG: hypothetical protein H7A25_19980 [Leptospiraceae bacterium]|nr:hypothetical protein [Leptospiraceae bacterium]